MSVKVKGLDKAISDLNKKFISVFPAIKDTLARTATDIEIEATRNAPSSYEIGDATINLSFIKQKINKNVSGYCFTRYLIIINICKNNIL